MKKGLVATTTIVFLFGIYLLAVILLSVFLSVNFLWILLALEVISIVIAMVVLGNQKRRLETRVRWALFIVFVPLIGLATYLFFGRPYNYRTNQDYYYRNFPDYRNRAQIRQTVTDIMPILDREVPEYRRSFLMGVNQQLDLIYRDSVVELLSNGADAWTSILRDIHKAEKYILINIYIIDTGELYNNVMAALRHKIKQGIRVYIIFDFYGTYGKFTRHMQSELRNQGFNLVAFGHQRLPFANRTSNYRDHRKDISIDGRIGYLGGLNLADEYINLSPHFGFWNDSMIRIRGSAVQGIEKIFVSDWQFYRPKRSHSILVREPSIGKLHPLTTGAKDLVQVVSSGPNHATPLHLDLMLNLINSAQRRIWLSTPYFVPPGELIKALAAAAWSGIDVRLLLPGKTDKKYLLNVSRFWTKELFDAGVKIYTLNRTFNHAKQFLFDDEIAFVGSTNIDYRAYFSDQQTMALVKSRRFNQQLVKNFEYDFKISTLYTTKPLSHHSWINHVRVWALNMVAPIL